MNREVLCFRPTSTDSYHFVCLFSLRVFVGFCLLCSSILWTRDRVEDQRRTGIMGKRWCVVNRSAQGSKCVALQLQAVGSDASAVIGRSMGVNKTWIETLRPKFFPLKLNVKFRTRKTRDGRYFISDTQKQNKNIAMNLDFWVGLSQFFSIFLYFLTLSTD